MDYENVTRIQIIQSPKDSDKITLIISHQEGDKTIKGLWPYAYANRDEAKFVVLTLAKRFGLSIPNIKYRQAKLPKDFDKTNDWSGRKPLPKLKTSATPYLGIALLCFGFVSLLVCSFFFVTLYVKPYIPWLGIVLVPVGSIMAWPIIKASLDYGDFDWFAAKFLGSIILILWPGTLIIEQYLRDAHIYWWGLPYIFGLIVAIGGFLIGWGGPLAALFLLGSGFIYIGHYNKIREKLK